MLIPPDVATATAHAIALTAARPCALPFPAQTLVGLNTVLINEAEAIVESRQGQGVNMPHLNGMEDVYKYFSCDLIVKAYRALEQVNTGLNELHTTYVDLLRKAADQEALRHRAVCFDPLRPVAPDPSLAWLAPDPGPAAPHGLPRMARTRPGPARAAFPAWLAPVPDPHPRAAFPPTWLAPAPDPAHTQVERKKKFGIHVGTASVKIMLSPPPLPPPAGSSRAGSSSQPLTPPRKAARVGSV